MAQNPIKGYRELSEHEIDLINQMKTLAENVGVAVDLLSQDKSFDQRWISIARTDLQKGFMALIRGIAQPETF